MVDSDPGTGRLSMTAPRIRVSCTNPARDCIYKNNTNVVVDLVGGFTTKIKAINEQIAWEGTVGGSCPAVLEWTGTYKVSQVSPLYVSR